MGNEQIKEKKEEISRKIEEMKNLICNLNYEGAKGIYQLTKYELNQIKDEDDINKISNYLIENYTDKKIGFIFLNIISNLRPNDKLSYLFQLIYENELMESIDKKAEFEFDDSKTIVIKKAKDDKKNFEKLKSEINIKMNRIFIVNNYIEFVYFKSLIFEKIAEKYYNLGTLMYSDFGTKKKQNSNELQEIIDLFVECISNYNKTGNPKIKLEEYTNALEKVKVHRDILKGKEYIQEEKFLEALKCFQNVNSNNAIMLEEKNKGIHFCHTKLAEIEEENKNYEKAIEYYMLIDNNLKIYELKIKINENYINYYIGQKQYIKTFEYFQNIFGLVNEAQNKEFVELKYSKIFILFVEIIIKLVIVSYQNNYLKNFIEQIEKINKVIKNEGINSEVKQLLSELRLLERNGSDKYFERIKKSANLGNKEIIQRFNLSLLIKIYFKIKPQQILNILLGQDIKLSYLNSESFIVLIQYLESKNDLLDLYLISKLIYKIIVSEGMFQENKYLEIIEKKIQEINNIPYIENDLKYNDVIEYLISSYQEIIINDNKINDYTKIIELICSVILKSNQFISNVSKIVLFLSSKEIHFELYIIEIIIQSLINVDNEKLLDSLFIQFQLNPKIIFDHLNSVYEILFNYQKLNIKNKNEKIEKIFNFLLSLPEELISSKLSIAYLEKYISEMEINHLCYKLIEKIPDNKRSIKLTNALLMYKDKKNMNNLKNFNNPNINKENMKYQYDYMPAITKEDLPLLEENLDDEFYVYKLIHYLKHQKFLFNYLNLEEICNHFSSSTKELFNLIIENKVNFDEKALNNLLNGFYKNSENAIKETFEIFDKIKQYQGNFPFAIEANLKIENFLYQKQYEQFKSYNIKLNEIFKDFSYLKGFAEQHQKFVLHLLILAKPEKKVEIIEEMKKFLIEKNFDIGTKIYEEILADINQDEFIKMIEDIILSKKINNTIKKMTLDKLYMMLIETENKINIIKSFKLFFDFIIIPDELFEYLINLLNSQISPEMYKEIMFCFGNYFSGNKKIQENYFKIINNKASRNIEYKNLVNKVRIVRDKRELLYLYTCINYININFMTKNENEILQLPVNIIANIIKSLNNKFNKNLFFENINAFNQFFHYNIFNTQRDKILRKLYFNHKKNPLNNLLLLCG